MTLAIFHAAGRVLVLSTTRLLHGRDVRLLQLDSQKQEVHDIQESTERIQETFASACGSSRMLLLFWSFVVLYIAQYILVIFIQLYELLKIIVGDFELAIINAVKEVFPNTRYLGYYFHLTQSLWRNIQEKGLSRSL